MLKVGTIVTVSQGSGIDSGRAGVVVDRSEVKTDGRGIPRIGKGHYWPINWKIESAVRLDDGDLITMFDDRLLERT